MGLKRIIGLQSERYGDSFCPKGQNEELREAFKMFEISQKGRMWAKDIGKILRCIGWNPSESDLEEAKKELETRVKGQVFFHDIERYVAQRSDVSVESAETDFQEAFNALDKSGDGKINVNDFRRFMTTLGEKMAPDEVEDLLKEAKATERECIDYRQLLEALELSS